ncbi:MAG: hypothetical protein DHS20C10_03130 [marine bacterium B5-7]|nr:MAG: hypothetical protein DHS20C10_03130 [marine bacterium B5-7]
MPRMTFTTVKAKTVNLTDADLSGDRVRQLASDLKIKKLILRGNRAPDLKRDDFIASLASLKNIQALDAAYCLLRDDGVQVLYQLRRLQQLDVSWNELSTKACRVFLALPLLQSLNISGNAIKSSGVNVLITQNKLLALKVSGDDISDLDLNALCDNRFLLSCDFTDNALRQEKEKNLTEVLPKVLAVNRAYAQCFFMACQSDSVFVVEYLLERGLVSPLAWQRKSYDDFEVGQDEYLPTGLHLAVLSRAYNVASYLAHTYPMLLSCRNASGQTPVELAQQLNNVSMIFLLRLSELRFKERKPSSLSASSGETSGIGASVSSTAGDNSPVSCQTLKWLSRVALEQNKKKASATDRKRLTK